MALTASQIASRLFKKSVGAGETLVSKQFFQEAYLGRDLVYSNQIWSQSDLIPTTAPVLSHGATQGVVRYFEKQALIHAPGSNSLSYYSPNLVDSIPFNYSNGSYNYKLYKSDGNTLIAFGEGDWLVDNTAGLLTFYGTLPSGVSLSFPPKITFYKYVGTKGFSAGSGIGTILGVTAGNGLSGGGTAGYINLDVNLGVNSGLTFSGDDIIIDSNIAGNGLDLNSGILSVNTSEITSSLAGAGLTSNGSALDVNLQVNSGLTFSGDNITLELNSDSLEVGSNNQVRLKDTITGNRTFQDSVTIDGDLTVNGTVSYINTENLYVVDNKITLNATYSGPYNIFDSGIEINLGGGTYSSLIWDSSNSLWAVGLSGSESTIITESGTGLTKSGNTLSIGNTSVTAGNYGNTNSVSTFTVNSQGQLTGATSVSISISSTQVNDFASASETQIFQGGNFVNGSTIDFSVTPGDSVTAEVTLASLTASRFDVTNSASASQGWTLGYNTSGQFEWFNPALTGDVTEVIAGNGLTGGGSSGSLTLDVNVDNGLSTYNDNVVLGGTLSQSTIINGNGYEFFISGAGTFSVTSSTSTQIRTYNNDKTSYVFTDEFGINLETAIDAGTYSRIDLINTQGILIESFDNADIVNLELSILDKTIGVGDGSSNNRIVITDDVHSKGLVYFDDYSANFTTFSVVTKGYVDSVINTVGSSAVYDRQNSSVTSGDASTTGMFLSSIPNIYSRVQVFVNGQLQYLGDGTLSSDCYFSNDGGFTPVALNALGAGDTLYWNGVHANFNLAITDSISIVYEA
jgi:hypothetical protein